MKKRRISQLLTSLLILLMAGGLNASALTLGEALDNTNLVWTTPGTNELGELDEVNWLATNSVTFDKVDAAMNAATGDNQKSSIETIVTGPGIISFWWNVDSEEGFDFLRFFVDREEGAESIFDISGQGIWEFRSYAIGNGQHTISWVFDRDVSGSAGSQSKGYLDQVKFTTGPEIPLGTALNTTLVTWTTGGNTNPTYWAGQTNVSHTDGKAAESGAITTSQESWMETTVAGVTNVSFWWKVSCSNNHGWLTFYVDNVQQFQITGEVGWQLKTNIAITSGTHTLRWATTNDVQPTGLTRGWVDEVAFQPPIALPAAPTNVVAVAGDGKATLSWSPVSGATSYQVRRSTTNGGPYSVIASGVTSVNYTNTGLVNGTAYYYVVGAGNFFGAGADSTQVAVRPVSLAQPSLGSTLQGAELHLSWPSDHTGWRLETQTKALTNGMGTNWSTVSGSSATNHVSIAVNTNNACAFFRLVYP